MTLEGWVPQIGDYLTLAEVIDFAFDYRGNTTLVKTDGTEVVGYVFNRNNLVPQPFIQFFDEMMDLGVEGMMLSPGYSYAKAPDQEHFLRRAKTHQLFSDMLSSPEKRWKFNQSPLFLQFLMGKRDFECTPWGNPTYNVFGWQRPCYLLQDGYARTFRELMEETDWSRYGRKSGNPRCQDCMVHCGFEPSAALGINVGLADNLKMLAWTLS